MIVAMKKASLICMKEDKNTVLKALQKSGEMMLCSVGSGSSSDGEASGAMRKMELLMRKLKPYQKKKGFLEGPPEIEAGEFDQRGDTELSLAKQADEWLEKIEGFQKEKDRLAAEISVLEPWKSLPTALDALGESSYTYSAVGILPAKSVLQADEVLGKYGAVSEILEDGKQSRKISVTVLKEQASDAMTELKTLGFEPATLPKKNCTALELVEELQKKQAEMDEALKKAQEALKTLMEKAEQTISLLYEQYRAENEREEAPLGETLETVYLEGWVRSDRMEKLEKAIAKATDVYSLSFRDPEEGETPPTAVKNNKWVSQFEGITDMFSSPNYREGDPNPVMAPWYWLIFGLMMGDAGYGLMMAVLIFAAKKVMKPSGSTLKLMNVMLYSSITTMLCGVVFGSYFGETWNPLWFSPMDDPVTMLIFTLVIGVLHIFTGMICKIVQNVKEGYVWDAIFDQVSWMLLILGLGMLFLEPLKTVGIVLAIVGALIVLCTAGREKKGILGKVTGGLVGLYGITSYMSDILSYSRILALSLATGVVGMVMNMLAGMIQGNIIGFVLSLVIYIAGHIFNLALGLLSAYVHDCRLQYIEFYGKFFEGGGEPFKPFAIHTNHIKLK